MEKEQIVPDLSLYNKRMFSPGKSSFFIAMWQVVHAFLISSWIPGSAYRRAVLRMFGAKIGKSVVIKPRVRIKYPWRLKIGDNSWIGESVWIDNLVEVRIGSNACLSQGAYLCTGSHDWSRATFDLKTAPIVVEDGAWVGAMVSVGPGVTIGQGAVATFGTVVVKSLEPWRIYRGVEGAAIRRMR